MIIISVVVRPHQVLHHQASHLVVHEVPRQLIFARSLSKSSYSSSWELKAELKHVWVNALANSQLPALPFEASLGASIWKYLAPGPSYLCTFNACSAQWKAIGSLSMNAHDVGAELNAPSNHQQSSTTPRNYSSLGRFHSTCRTPFMNLCSSSHRCVKYLQFWFKMVHGAISCCDHFEGNLRERRWLLWRSRMPQQRIARKSLIELCAHPSFFCFNLIPLPFVIHHRSIMRP